MPNETSTGLEEPLLETREGPALDGNGQELANRPPARLEGLLVLGTLVWIQSRAQAPFSISSSVARGQIELRRIGGWRKIAVVLPKNALRPSSIRMVEPRLH